MIKRLKWEEKFSVGVPAMDQEHRRIIGMINKLQDEFACVHKAETVAELLTEMTQYAQDHFQHEERMLAAHNYPRMLEQHAQHVGYRKKNVALCQATRLDITGLYKFLRNWWAHHILEEDMRYKAFFAGMTAKEKL